MLDNTNSKKGGKKWQLEIKVIILFLTYIR